MTIEFTTIADNARVFMTPGTTVVLKIARQNDVKYITVRVLDDGTINIATPDGAITKIWG